MTEHLKSDTRSVNSLPESIDMLQTDIKDFSTYISINQDIHNLLTKEYSAQMAQESAQKLWLQDAPMQLVQDMIALKGHIKTIAIYSENGMPLILGHDMAQRAEGSPPAYMKTNGERNHGGKLKEKYQAQWTDEIIDEETDHMIAAFKQGEKIL